jgi:hypothetical protein
MFLFLFISIFCYLLPKYDLEIWLFDLEKSDLE